MTEWQIIDMMPGQKVKLSNTECNLNLNICLQSKNHLIMFLTTSIAQILKKNHFNIHHMNMELIPCLKYEHFFTFIFEKQKKQRQT